MQVSITVILLGNWTNFNVSSALTFLFGLYEYILVVPKMADRKEAEEKENKEKEVM